jgi:methylated-DNA-[protein]-cysteine S-methyltransferase
MNAPVAAFVTFPAPWGILHVAATSKGIVAVDLGAETPFFVDDLARRLHGTVLPAEDGDVPAEWRAALDEATRQIGEFLSGARQAMTVPIDLRVSDWDRLVLTGAARLQFGETASYGELARRVGRPGAAQAVGGAMNAATASIFGAVAVTMPSGLPPVQAPVNRPRLAPSPKSKRTARFISPSPLAGRALFPASCG